MPLSCHLLLVMLALVASSMGKGSDLLKCGLKKAQEIEAELSKLLVAGHPNDRFPIDGVESARLYCR